MQRSGIDKLIPEMKMDDFLFLPFGYSMNGILKDVRICNEDIACNLLAPQATGTESGQDYMTIHVTPQVNIRSTIFLSFYRRVVAMPVLKPTPPLLDLTLSTR